MCTHSHTHPKKSSLPFPLSSKCTHSTQMYPPSIYSPLPLLLFRFILQNFHCSLLPEFVIIARNMFSILKLFLFFSTSLFVQTLLPVVMMFIFTIRHISQDWRLSTLHSLLLLLPLPHSFQIFWVLLFYCLTAANAIE